MGSQTFGNIGVLGLYTETPLHCGAESTLGYVDSPIQRERHTFFPVIPGSSIKGVLKDEVPRGARRDEIFGSTTSPGHVSFGDGSIVAFPVRSSEALFFWVTCPTALERVFRAIGEDLPNCAPSAGEGLAASAGELLLEEHSVIRTARPDLFGAEGVLVRLLELIPPDASGFAYTRKVFLQRLVIVGDEDFKELVQTCTDVVTRIKLTGLKTTKDLDKEDYPDFEDEDLKGNMFVEETVPPETLFFAPLRAASGVKIAADILPTCIRLGGDETVGRGLTHVTFRVPTLVRVAAMENEDALD